MNKTKKTGKVYGFLWKKVKKDSIPQFYHFAEIQELVQEPIAVGKIGIDVGAGCGYDINFIAKNNPGIGVVGLDLSDGIYKAKEISAALKNVSFIQGSALALPLKDETFDFAYSFGVLHHTTDPSRGTKEISRILKKGAKLFIYLYEDHSGNRVKYFLLRLITFVRQITTRMPKAVLYSLSFLSSPIIVLLFSYPSRLMKKFTLTKRTAERMPFNFGTHPFSVTGDLYDRFSAPIEYRYNKSGMYDLLSNNGFTDIKIDKLKTKAGWVAWGLKK